MIGYRSIFGIGRDMSIFLLLCMLLCAPLSAAEDKILNLDPYAQKEYRWCWAACCQAIFNYYGVYSIKSYDGVNTFDISSEDNQCQIVEWARLAYASGGSNQPKNFGEVDCCIDPGYCHLATDPPCCNQNNNMANGAGSIANILLNLGNINSTKLYEIVLTESEIKDQIDDLKPFIMYWEKGESSWLRSEWFGHFVVVYGYSGHYDSNNNYTLDMVYYMEPGIDPVFQSSSYEELKFFAPTDDKMGHEWISTQRLDTIPPHAFIEKGLQWLRDSQNDNGSWTMHFNNAAGGDIPPTISWDNVWLTSVTTLAFLNYGIRETDSTVSKAVTWLLDTQNSDDGSISTAPSLDLIIALNSEVQDTAFAILALVATRSSQNYGAIQSAVNYLVNLQYNESAGYSDSDVYYGGWASSKAGYENRNRPFVENSKLALSALHYAEKFDPTDTIVPVDLWGKAEKFLTKCQNRTISNPEYGFTNDGGFMATPYEGEDVFAPAAWPIHWKESRGDYTAKGLWSLHLCGIKESDGRVSDAWNWLENDYQGFNYEDLSSYGSGVSEYIYDVAQTYLIWDRETVAGSDWYSDMVSEITSDQYSDGHWSRSDGGYESDMAATALAILSLESKRIPPGTGLNLSLIHI